MARMPRQIRVGHQLLELRREAIADGDLGEFCNGGNGEPHYIALNDALTGPELARVFLHEVAHAIFHSYIPIETFNRVARAKKPDREDLEEVFCDALGKGLAQFWRDNPAAVRWVNSLLEVPRMR